MKGIDREEVLNLFDSKRNPARERTELLFYSSILVFFLVVVTYFNAFIITNVYVSGNSMEPTISTGDVLFINMTKKPKYYDIIVIKAVENGEPYIKRVIGLSGDTVWCENGKVMRSFTDGKGEEVIVTVDDYFTDTVTEDFAPITVGDNQVFFMGDNRHKGASEDSRSIGAKSLDNVIGVVTKWSLKQKNFLTKAANFFKY